MNMDNLNKWLALAANVGVIAGIIFLAIEIQQNTEMMRSQTRDNMAGKQLNLFEWFATSTDNAAIRDRGGRGELEAGSPEYAQFGWMVAGTLRLWENEWYQYQQGLFEVEEFEPRLNIWRGVLLGSPGLIDAWDDIRPSFSPEFSALIDSLILNNNQNN
jgi:hypothetical protein